MSQEFEEKCKYWENLSKEVQQKKERDDAWQHLYEMAIHFAYDEEGAKEFANKYIDSYCGSPKKK